MIGYNFSRLKCIILSYVHKDIFDMLATTLGYLCQRSDVMIVCSYMDILLSTCYVCTMSKEGKFRTLKIICYKL